jgi:hypothetical protein
MSLISRVVSDPVGVEAAGGPYLKGLRPPTFTCSLAALLMVLKAG